MQPTPPIEVVLSSLIEALSIEKERLLAGDYADLPKISERKAHYMSILDRYLNDPATVSHVKAHIRDIEIVKTAAQENEKLLIAAKAGAVAAQNRLTRMANKETMVGAYTAEGDKLRTHDSEVTRQKIA